MKISNKYYDYIFIFIFNILFILGPFLGLLLSYSHGRLKHLARYRSSLWVIMLFHSISLVLYILGLFNDYFFACFWILPLVLSFLLSFTDLLAKSSAYVKLTTQIIFFSQIGFIFLGIFLPSLINSPNAVKVDKAKNNILIINKALDDYYKQYSQYPDNVNILIEQNYLSNNYLLNPFSKNDKSIYEEPFGYTPKFGNFTYIPIYNMGIIDNYFILLYGPHGHIDINKDGKSDDIIFVFEKNIIINYEKNYEDRINYLSGLISIKRK